MQPYDSTIVFWMSLRFWYSLPDFRAFWKHQAGAVNNRRGKKNLVLSAWGDDSLLSEENINPYYVPDSYQSYKEQTRQNLVSAFEILFLKVAWFFFIFLRGPYNMEIKIIVQKRLNEDVIDYDLLEDLVCHVDETCDEGAILVFLPVSPSDSLFAFF